MGSVEAAGGEGGGDDLAGEHFAEGGDVVGGAGSDFADGGDAAQEFVERFEVGAQFGMEFGEARGAEQFAGGVVVAFLQRAAEFERGLAFACAGGARHGQQGVGDFGHGADHDDRLLWQASLNDGGDAVDGLGVFDGSAAELHDDHRQGFLGKVTHASGAKALSKNEVSIAALRGLRHPNAGCTRALRHSGYERGVSTETRRG